MASYRIEKHPILPVEPRASVAFTWQGRELGALEGETIASALFANGVRVFGHHPKDGSPQGIFCANGQCAQCLVLADGMPVKSCMELVRPGLRVEPADGLPELPKVASAARHTRDPRDRGSRPDHRRRAGRHVRGDPARPARHPDAAGGRQAPPGRQAGAANPPLLRLGERGLCGHARDRYRDPAGTRGAGNRLRRGLAGQHCAGGVQRPEGGDSQGTTTRCRGEFPFPDEWHAP